MTTTEENSDTYGRGGEAPAELIQRFSKEFDMLTLSRHEMGSEKYGAGKFLMVDTMQEALFELADLANYARYSFIRVRLLQEQIKLQEQPTFKKTLD